MTYTIDLERKYTTKHMFIKKHCLITIKTILWNRIDLTEFSDETMKALT